MLSGFLWQHLTHLNIFFAVTWLPWQMITAHTISSRSKTSTLNYIAYCLCLALPFLVGQFQIPLLISLVSVSYLATRLTQQNIWKKTTTFKLLITAITGFLIASPQILPTLELVSYSNRAAGANQFDIRSANQHSFALYHLPTFIFPHFYGNGETYWGKRLEIEYGTFIGTIPILFILALFIHFKQIHQPRKFFISLATISCLLSLGSLSPFRLIGIEPSLWIFSAPARWLLFTTFSLAILSGDILDLVQKKIFQKHLNTIFKKTLYILLLIIGITNVAIFTPKIASYTIDQLSQSAPTKADFYSQKITSIFESARQSSLSLYSPYTYLPLIALGLFILTLKKRPTFLPPVIIIVTTLELLIVNTTTTPFIRWAETLRPPATLSALPDALQNQEARLYTIRDGGDTGAYFTNPETRPTKAKRNSQQNLIIPLLNLPLNIPGMEWPASLPFSAHQIAIESIRGQTTSYQIENFEAAANLNIGAAAVPDYLDDGSLEDQSLSQTTQSGIHIYELPFSPRFEISSGTLETQKIDNKGAHILKTDSDTPATLLIRDSWYPGWNADIDGTITPISLNQPFFQQVTLPAGSHTVKLLYSPNKIYLGIILSLTTLFIIGLLVTFGQLKKKS